MITAVDTNVILDILVEDPDHAKTSQQGLRESRLHGTLVISDIVIAEVSPVIGDQLDRFLDDYHIQYVPTSIEAAKSAGLMFASYLKHGGKRGHIVADFLIGAHSLDFADRLLTRDRGFKRLHFKKLTTWYPQTN